jgi:hypothetical protein
MDAAEVLAEAGRRLTADLRTRFPGIEVTLTSTADGLVSVDVNHWGTGGEIDLGVDVDEVDYTRAETERFVEAVVFLVADNVWPDELMEPWPPCPEHADHPLQVSVHLGQAAWVCLRDPKIAIPVGTLLSA